MDKMSFASNLVVKSSGRQMCGLAFPNDIGGDKVAESRWHIGHGAYGRNLVLLVSAWDDGLFIGQFGAKYDRKPFLYADFSQSLPDGFR